MILHILIAMVAGWLSRYQPHVITSHLEENRVRWYKQRIAQKCDGSTQRHHLGRPQVAEELAQRVVRMADENPIWGARRLQGALANLGQHVDKLTVRTLLRRHEREPAPQRRKAGMELDPVSDAVLGGTSCNRLLHGQGGNVARPRDRCYAGGDGRGDPVRAGRRHHAASSRGLHAVVRPAVDCPLRGFLLGKRSPTPRQGHEVHTGL